MSDQIDMPAHVNEVVNRLKTARDVVRSTEGSIKETIDPVMKGDVVENENSSPVSGKRVEVELSREYMELVLKYVRASSPDEGRLAEIPEGSTLLGGDYDISSDLFKFIYLVKS